MSDDLTRRIARIIEEGRPIYGDPNEQARRILVLVVAHCCLEIVDACGERHPAEGALRDLLAHAQRKEKP